jgi:hypothetical protein
MVKRRDISTKKHKSMAQKEKENKVQPWYQAARLCRQQAAGAARGTTSLNQKLLMALASYQAACYLASWLLLPLLFIWGVHHISRVHNYRLPGCVLSRLAGWLPATMAVQVGRPPHQPRA